MHGIFETLVNEMEIEKGEKFPNRVYSRIKNVQFEFFIRLLGWYI